MKKALFLLTLLTVVTISTTVFAVVDVMYSRGPDLNSTNAYSSIVLEDEIYHHCFTDYYYDGSFTMTDFHWWGYPFYSDYMSGFTFQIWSEAAGAPAPGTLIYEEYFAGDANAQYFATHSSFGDVYKYGIDLTTPFAPTEAGKYWFSVLAHTDGGSNWFWHLGSGVEFDKDWQHAYIGTGSEHWDNNLDADFAFEITGEYVIPEPGTLILLGFGLMGLAARRFKK